MQSSCVTGTSKSKYKKWKLGLIQPFCRYKNDIGEPHLQPTFDNLRAFFDNLAAERPGILGDRLSLQTLEIYMWRLRLGLRKEHGVEIPLQVIHGLINVGRCLEAQSY